MHPFQLIMDSTNRGENGWEDGILYQHLKGMDLYVTLSCTTEHYDYTCFV